MTITLFKFLQLCSFSLFMVAGQIFFKFAALNAPPMTSVSNILSLVTNYWFWGAIFFYGISTLIWISVLQTTPLSLAYPFVALGFIFIPLASYVLFKEPLSWQYGAGVVLILVALKLISGGLSVK